MKFGMRVISAHWRLPVDWQTFVLCVLCMEILTDRRYVVYIRKLCVLRWKVRKY